MSCPTVIDCLSRLEELGLVVSTTHQRGKVQAALSVRPADVLGQEAPSSQLIRRSGGSRPLGGGVAEEGVVEVAEAGGNLLGLAARNNAR